jgi:hypothetical protein
MRHSDDIAALSEALALAQGVARDAVYDSTNPAFKSRYASLSSVLNAIRGPLTANGLALAMAPVYADGRAGVEWMLTHKSGQWMAGEVLYRLAQDTPQGAGSATTYARRYTASALGLIAADDDDDGNAGSAPAPSRAEPAKSPRMGSNSGSSAAAKPAASAPVASPPAPTEPSTSAPATEAQKARLFAIVTGAGATERHQRANLAHSVLGPDWGGSYRNLTSAQCSRLADAMEGPDAMPADALAAILALPADPFGE